MPILHDVPQYMRVMTLPELPFRDYRKATSALEERLKKGAEA